MPANNRIFYATQAVLLRPMSADGTSLYSNWYRPKGLQSVGITTNFTLEQVFQLGQLDLYDQVEEVPEVEVTMSKVVDGTAPLYLMCVGGSSGITGANGKGLAEIANNRVNVRLGIFSDTNSAASGTARTYVDCSGMYLSSISYTFPVDGNATEDVTLVGNHKVWNSGSALGGAVSDFGFKNDTTAESSPATARRYKFDPTNSTLPTGAGGIPIPSGGTRTFPYLQSVTVSTDLGREAINELGRMAPYFRYVTFPVEVTSEFEVIGADGDYVNANDFITSSATCDTTYKNLTDKTIVIKVCGTGSSDSMTIDLGAKNKLTSVNYTGGDTGGGNVTNTYSFQTFNSFKVSVTGTSFASGASAS